MFRVFHTGRALPRDAHVCKTRHNVEKKLLRFASKGRLLFLKAVFLRYWCQKQSGQYSSLVRHRVGTNRQARRTLKPVGLYLAHWSDTWRSQHTPLWPQLYPRTRNAAAWKAIKQTPTTKIMQRKRLHAQVTHRFSELRLRKVTLNMPSAAAPAPPSRIASTATVPGIFVLTMWMIDRL